MPDTEYWSLVYEESRRLLVRQEATLDGLRTKAIAVLSAAAVVNGLMIKSGPDRWAAIAGGAAFVVLAILILVILRPRTWTFAAKLNDWIDVKDQDPPFEARDFTYNMAKHFEESRQAQVDAIDQLHNLFEVAAALLALQVAIWIAAVIW